jgi:hypothetical protein
MFGERAIPDSDAGRRAAFEEFRSKKLLARARAGFEAILAQPQVDNEQIAAIGFCFGGMVALELARFGPNLKGVVSVHVGNHSSRFSGLSANSKQWASDSAIIENVATRTAQAKARCWRRHIACFGWWTPRGYGRFSLAVGSLTGCNSVSISSCVSAGSAKN